MFAPVKLFRPNPEAEVDAEEKKSFLYLEGHTHGQRPRHPQAQSPDHPSQLGGPQPSDATSEAEQREDGARRRRRRSERKPE
jgi:hypothetical protein